MNFYKISKRYPVSTKIICFGEQVIGEGLALMIVDAWLNAEFIEGKHQIRLNLIKEIEEKYNK